MPSKRDLNVFGTSFLDLLTCALAAMIILFVIVPKTMAEGAYAAGPDSDTEDGSLPEEPDTVLESADIVRYDSETLLGSFSGFGLLVEWQQRDADVNIGVQRYGLTPEQCGWDHPVRDWGVFLKETRPESGKKRCALFFMPDIYPDDYTLWVEFDGKSPLKRADVTATMLFHPGASDEGTYRVGPVSLTDSMRVYIATITIADCGVITLSHREPLW